MRLDTEATASGRLGIVRRFPIGPVLGIAPFNFPLNLVCHKVGPALASGNPIVVKPASATPLSALALGEILVEAGAADAISVLTCCELGSRARRAGRSHQEGVVHRIDRRRLEAQVARPEEEGHARARRQRAR